MRTYQIVNASRIEAADEASPRAALNMALDINTAQRLRLKSLTGIGEYYAKKILAGRPYLIEKIYARIMERLCAGPSYENEEDGHRIFVNVTTADDHARCQPDVLSSNLNVAFKMNGTTI